MSTIWMLYCRHIISNLSFHGINSLKPPKDFTNCILVLQKRQFSCTAKTFQRLMTTLPQKTAIIEKTMGEKQETSVTAVNSKPISNAKCNISWQVFLFFIPILIAKRCLTTKKKKNKANQGNVIAANTHSLWLGNRRSPADQRSQLSKPDFNGHLSISISAAIIS